MIKPITQKELANKDHTKDMYTRYFEQGLKKRRKSRYQKLYDLLPVNNQIILIA